MSNSKQLTDSLNSRGRSIDIHGISATAIATAVAVTVHTGAFVFNSVNNEQNVRHKESKTHMISR